jgi:hypothetical protein
VWVKYLVGLSARMWRLCYEFSVSLVLTTFISDCSVKKNFFIEEIYDRL